MPEVFEVRSAVLADAEGIAKVHTRSWQSAYRGILPDAWLDNLQWENRKKRWDAQLPARNQNIINVATDAKGRIVGFASVGPTRDEDLDPHAIFELYAIYMDPEFWRTGIGGTLMAITAMQISPEIHGLSLWVLQDNASGKAFYERLGFLADGAVKIAEIDGHYRDEIRYQAALPLSPID